MHKIIVLLLLFISIPVYGQSSVSLSYGLGRLADGDKKKDDVEPDGNVYKLVLAERGHILEIGGMIRYAEFSDKFNFAGKEAKLVNRNLSYGSHLGIWVLPFFQIHGGFARHIIHEHVKGNFTVLEDTQIYFQYDVKNRDTYGLYGGVDFSLISTKYIQIFASYDYYHLAGLDSNIQEVMGGIRFYFGEAGRKRDKGDKAAFGDFFSRLFDALFFKK